MLSLIVPVYNGRTNLQMLSERIAETLCHDDYELIFIDDGSTDGSLEEIKRLCAELPRAGWVSLAGNYGQQMAVLCGLRHSCGDWIVTLDDDLQHPPEIISVMIKKAKEGFDAIYAVSEAPGTGGNSPGGRLRDLFFRLFLKKPAGLRIGSYRVFSRRAVNLIVQASAPFIYVSAELFKYHLRVTSITYTVKRTAANTSRYSTAKRIRLYMKLFRWYGPFSRLTRRITTGTQGQYKIAEKGGCL